MFSQPIIPGVKYRVKNARGFCQDIMAASSGAALMICFYALYGDME